MACARPLKLFKYSKLLKGNSLYPTHRQTGYTFGNIPKGAEIIENIDIPCGWCLNCRVDKRNYLEDVCNEEYKNKGYATFLTLTYDNEHIQHLLKYNLNNELVATLSKKDLQNFNKRLRSYINYHNLNNEYCQKNYKFLAVGEYGLDGNQFDRPHYHLIIFGLDFEFCKEIYKKCWDKGIIDSGPLMAGGIRYVLKYIDKQQNGMEAHKKYTLNGLEKPFCIHSIKLGYSLFERQKEFILKNNYQYKGKHNQLRPLPKYIKDLWLVKPTRNTEQITDKMFQYNIPKDKKENRYTLKQINDFRHNQAIIRHNELTEKLRQQGKPAEDIKHFDFDSMDILVEIDKLKDNTFNLPDYTIIDNEIIPF